MNTQQDDTPNQDNDFLQDWLEKRYGCGFTQMVLDDLGQAEPEIHAPYDMSGMSPCNDNSHPKFRHSA